MGASPTEELTEKSKDPETQPAEQTEPQPAEQTEAAPTEEATKATDNEGEAKEIQVNEESVKDTNENVDNLENAPEIEKPEEEVENADTETPAEADTLSESENKTEEDQESDRSKPQRRSRSRRRRRRTKSAAKVPEPKSAKISKTDTDVDSAQALEDESMKAQTEDDSKTSTSTEASKDTVSSENAKGTEPEKLDSVTEETKVDDKSMEKSESSEIVKPEKEPVKPETVKPEKSKETKEKEGVGLSLRKQRELNRLKSDLTQAYIGTDNVFDLEKGDEEGRRTRRGTKRRKSHDFDENEDSSKRSISETRSVSPVPAHDNRSQRSKSKSLEREIKRRVPSLSKLAKAALPPNVDLKNIPKVEAPHKVKPKGRGKKSPWLSGPRRRRGGWRGRGRGGRGRGGHAMITPGPVLLLENEEKEMHDKEIDESDTEMHTDEEVENEKITPDKEEEKRMMEEKLEQEKLNQEEMNKNKFSEENTDASGTSNVESRATPRTKEGSIEPEIAGLESEKLEPKSGPVRPPSKYHIPSPTRMKTRGKRTNVFEMLQSKLLLDEAEAEQHLIRPKPIKSPARSESGETTSVENTSIGNISTGGDIASLLAEMVSQTSTSNVAKPSDVAKPSLPVETTSADTSQVETNLDKSGETSANSSRVIVTDEELLEYYQCKPCKVVAVDFIRCLDLEQLHRSPGSTSPASVRGSLSPRRPGVFSPLSSLNNSLEVSVDGEEIQRLQQLEAVRDKAAAIKVQEKSETKDNKMEDKGQTIAEIVKETAPPKESVPAKETVQAKESVPQKEQSSPKAPEPAKEAEQSREPSPSKTPRESSPVKGVAEQDTAANQRESSPAPKKARPDEPKTAYEAQFLSFLSKPSTGVPPLVTPKSTTPKATPPKPGTKPSPSVTTPKQIPTVTAAQESPSIAAAKPPTPIPTPPVKPQKSGIKNKARKSLPSAKTSEPSPPGLTETHATVNSTPQLPVPPHTKAFTPGEHSESKSTKAKFLCKHCTYTSANRGVMQEHIYNHTSIVPYSCGYCGAIFGTKSGVMTHNKREHKDAPPVVIKTTEINEEEYYTSTNEASTVKASLFCMPQMILYMGFSFTEVQFYSLDFCTKFRVALSMYT